MPVHAEVTRWWRCKRRHKCKCIKAYRENNCYLYGNETEDADEAEREALVGLIRQEATLSASSVGQEGE